MLCCMQYMAAQLPQAARSVASSGQRSQLCLQRASQLCEALRLQMKVLQHASLLARVALVLLQGRLGIRVLLHHRGNGPAGRQD